LLLFSAEAINAAREGLETWLINVVPALFPFMVATNIILKTIVIKPSKIGIALSKIFNIYNPFFLPFIVGFTAGAPLSSKVIAELLRKNEITQNEAQRLLSFCSNIGIVFILGTVGSILNDIALAKNILIIHYLSALVTGFLFRFYKYREQNIKLKINIDEKKQQAFSTVFKDSIIVSVKNILMIGGYIIFFSVIIQFLIISRVPHYISQISEYEQIKALAYGFIEITTALNYTNSAIVITTILSFTGISIISQSIAFLEKTGINFKVFILSKILHATIAFILSTIVF